MWWRIVTEQMGRVLGQTMVIENVGVAGMRLLHGLAVLFQVGDELAQILGGKILARDDESRHLPQLSLWRHALPPPTIRAAFGQEAGGSGRTSWQ